MSVFFDASGTTTDGSVTKQPFHDLEYRWNFGENQSALAALPGGTNWTNGSVKGSRNLATGPVAAHVFETPGTYTVALSATDGTNTANNCAQIVVQDPNTVFSGTNTICVAATSLPVAGASGCPAGATTVQQPSFSAAISSYAQTGKRVLFKRGDTFTAATRATIAATGPGTIGAYGTGNKPLIQNTGNTDTFILSSGANDWRIMDLTIDGLSGGSTGGLTDSGLIKQVTILRLDLQNIHYGFRFDTSGKTFNGLWDGVTIADSTINHTVAAGYQIYAAGYRFSIIGNSFSDNLNGQSLMRLTQAVKSVISDNSFSGQAPTYEYIKLHAPSWCRSGCNWTTDTLPVDPIGNNGTTTFGYSEKVVISGNKFTGSAGAAWEVSMGPQNGTYDERTRDVIFERNWLIAGSGTGSAVAVFSRDTSIRNNICDFSAVAAGACFRPDSWGAAPPADNVKIYNNTAYTSAPSGGYPFKVVQLMASVTNITVQNNLAYSPSNNLSVMVAGTGPGLVVSNNSSDAQMRGVSPKFASPLTAPDGFKVAPDSYAVGNGKVAPVWSDFSSVPQTTTKRDIGAVIH
ncbi:MAG TPA: PKD domain-containing protein [Gallionellaceae bacterium]|nr:PKD domain-containing protein [Gallionellaceae bacterium]